MLKGKKFDAFSLFDSLELVFDSLELMFQSLEHRFICSLTIFSPQNRTKTKL